MGQSTTILVESTKFLFKPQRIFLGVALRRYSRPTAPGAAWPWQWSFPSLEPHLLLSFPLLRAEGRELILSDPRPLLSAPN